ncbi:MAG: hypothetical protein V2A78_06870 [bacterium]
MLFLLLVLPLAAEPPVSVSATLDKKTATIGEPIELTITLTYDSRVVLEEPLIAALVKSLAEPKEGLDSQVFDILEEKPPESRMEQRKKAEIFHYRIAFFKSGKTAFPELPVNFKDLKGRAARARSSPVEIEIKSALAAGKNPKDIRDIKGPLWMNYPWYYYAAGVLLLLLFALLVLFLLHLRRKSRAATEAVKPVRPPWETALENFSALENSGLISDGKIKEFYVRLTDIFRIYLEERYGIPALDRTTMELYGEMKKGEVPREHAGAARDLLARCDQVKFAKYVPPEEEIKTALAEGRRIVQVTIPNSPPVPGERGTAS